MGSAVRWRMGGLPVEVRCGDRQALRRAALVLRGAIHLEPAEDAVAVSWRLSPPAGEPDPVPDGPPDEAGSTWLVRRQDTGETWRRRDLDVALRVVEFGSVMALVEGAYGLVTLHGALLERAGRGLLILGPCESGKSTLAAALWRDGWTLLGDDVAVADRDGGARPLQRRVSLRHGSRDLLGEALWERVVNAPSCSATDEGYLFHPADLDGTPPPASTRLAGIVFLARRGIRTGPSEVAPITPAQALLAAAPYSNVIRRQGLGPALECLQPLVEAAPAFDLGRGPLPSMVAAIEGATMRATLPGAMP